MLYECIIDSGLERYDHSTLLRRYSTWWPHQHANGMSGSDNADVPCACYRNYIVCVSQRAIQMCSALTHTLTASVQIGSDHVTEIGIAVTSYVLLMSFVGVRLVN